MTNQTQTRFLLNESDLPKSWYNVMADSPLPPTPVLRPDTLEPVTPDFLSVLFPMELILQEISMERYIEIPEEVREIYKLYRPTPLIPRGDWKKHWIRPRIFITNTKVLHLPEATSRIPPLRRPTITKRLGQRRSPPKPARDNGDPHWRWLAASSALISKYIWSRFHISKSRIAAS